MESIFADRVSKVPQSFIREILKVNSNPRIISFAGGLPNRDLFPIQEIKVASDIVLDKYGNEALQYGATEGLYELRKYISDRYRERDGFEISPDNILITNGSQQGLDLLSRVLLNSGDDIIFEEPGYLGALQVFMLYNATFNPVPVSESGLDIKVLKEVMHKVSPKIIYGVPNFQNPSGICYSEENRRELAEVLIGTKTFYVQDDPYGELRFSGKPKASFMSLIPNNTILLGSFSKIVAPSLRLGWITAPDHIMEKLIIVKQATDLHTSYYIQKLVHQYLIDNDLGKHISAIKKVYGCHCQTMLDAIGEHFPENVKHTTPEGGMFLWVSLPEKISSLKLFHEAAKELVSFVPGHPFYLAPSEVNTLRLNFSYMNPGAIQTGIQRLGRVMKNFVGSSQNSVKL